MPNTLCFDLDDTLWDDGASLHACVLQVCDGLVAHLPPFDAMALTQDYIQRSDEYWMTRRYDAEVLPDARLQLWTETLCNYGCNDPEIAAKARDAYAAHRRAFAVCYDETAEVISTLSQRYRLVAITNGPGDVQRARLQVAGLDGYFLGVIAATDVEVAKPSAAMFEHALRLVDSTPSDAWHVGDSLGSDVAGARNAGLDAAVWLNRNGMRRADTDPQPHHEIQSLRDLVSLLDRHGS